MYKKGDRSQAVNYRPVSLTSICCKTMEHIVYWHIIEHLENHQILSDNQHGFRKHRSCETQLVNTIETVARSLDKKEQVDMLILAFDTVPHQSRINKMEHYGIKSNIHRWVSSWLTQRHQRVCVDEEENSNKPVRSGIPQGTVLGPLCFLIYINNMEKSISRTSTLCLFADDWLLYRPGNTTDGGKRLQEDLTELTKWAEKWQMTFHPAKCYILRVTRKKNPIITNYEMLDNWKQYINILI